MLEDIKISIITVSYNSGNTIERTINSVLSQTYENIEYIIVDGASSDNTLEITDKYKDKISKIISEPDNGIYDAMNKGINVATGHYIYLLNSDDVLFDEDVINVFASKMRSGKEIYYGNLMCRDIKNERKTITKQNVLNKIMLLKNTPYQPTTFYKKDVFDKCGYFDTAYKIVADYEWALRAFLKHNVSSEYVDYTVNIFSIGGVSTNPEYDKKHDVERMEVLKKYFTDFELKSYGFISKYLRSLVKNPITSSFLNIIFKYEL